MNDSEQKKIDSVKTLFEQNDEVFSDEDIEVLTPGPIEKPFFPLHMVLIALLKDTADFFFDITGVGVVFATLLTLPLIIIMFMWCHHRLSGGFWKKKVIGWLWKRYVYTIIIELIPFFHIIPTSTIFILMAHYKEVKIVKLFNLALETLYPYPNKESFSKNLNN